MGAGSGGGGGAVAWDHLCTGKAPRWPAGSLGGQDRGASTAGAAHGEEAGSSGEVKGAGRTLCKTEVDWRCNPLFTLAIKNRKNNSGTRSTSF